jgi:hypothetical protein
MDLPSAFVEPTILTGVSPAMRASHEELFGPVAVALANDTPFGLGESVFAADIGRAQRVAARLDVGMARINLPAPSRPGPDRAAGPSASSPSTATERSSCCMRHAPRTSSGTSWSAPSAARTRPTATTCSPSTSGEGRGRPGAHGQRSRLTVVRPVFLQDELRTGRIRLAEQPLRGKVPRADVAGVLAAVLHEPRSAQRVLYVSAGDDPIEEALARVL